METNGWHSAEPGPSTWTDDHWSDKKEAQILAEADELEEQVGGHPQRPRAATTSSPTASKRPLSLHLGSLHASSSEIFDAMSPPPIVRHTTYSSLPPSPRREAELAFGQGLGIRELEEVLKRISAKEEKKAEEEKEEVRLDTPVVDKGKGAAGMWDLLVGEEDAEWDSWVVGGKWERISNFLAVPLALEKVTLFGALLCLDGFLYNFTILPIRAAVALSKLPQVNPARLHSILRMLLLVIPTVILLLTTDASKMYHTVRGQDTIKLYVIFNVLEIGDRLCCAFGQDVLDTLFARETLSMGKRKRERARPVFFFALSVAYVLAHTLIYFYMLISLNVAINSYDYTLLSLLISNQFVEIKGSVFKKFEKENLFQIMCADIVERFQLGLLLVVIALRNMIEMAGSDLAFLPKSYIKGKSLVETILSPVLFVLVSEMVVDWLKHAFITKFNHVKSSIYGRFIDVLAKDVLTAGRRKGGKIMLDQSPLVARRLGFASIPLACLVIRICAGVIGGDHGWAVWFGVFGLGTCAWGCLVGLKILLGLSLLSFSALRQAGMDARESEEAMGSSPNETKEEVEYNKQTTKYLSHPEDDLPEFSSPTSVKATPNGMTTPKDKKKWRLEDVERWTMVKRIW